MTDRPPLPDGLVVVVKRDCATCLTVVPVLVELARGPEPLTVYVQDDLSPFAALAPRDDTDLAVSWHHDIETVPTLLRITDGEERDRTVGWSRARGRSSPAAPGWAPTCRSCGRAAGRCRSTRT